MAGTYSDGHKGVPKISRYRVSGVALRSEETKEIENNECSPSVLLAWKFEIRGFCGPGYIQPDSEGLKRAIGRPAYLPKTQIFQQIHRLSSGKASGISNI